MRTSRLVQHALVAMVLVLLFPASALAAPGRNNTNAKMCQASWQDLKGRDDGTRFASKDECVSYAARGGTLVPTRPWILATLGEPDENSYCIVTVVLTDFRPNTAYTLVT